MTRLRQKVVPIDFEYHSSEERDLHLVCCSLEYKGKIYEYWLNDNSDRNRLLRNLLRINDEGYALLCFNATAEGRALLSLQLGVTKFKWVDLNAEWKMLTNHWDEYGYGEQYSKGKYITTRRPKGYKAEGENNSKAKHNLLACTFKMTGRKERDSEYKDKMRDLILTRDFDLIEKNKKEIQEYCSSDIRDLPEIMGKIFDAYNYYFGRFTYQFDFAPTPDEILYRGMSMARTAIMMREGYPVDVEKLQNFANNIPNILKDCIEDINSQFEWDLFSPNKSAHGYKQNQVEWKKFISEGEYAENWTKTATGDYALSLDAFEKHFSWRHEFPRNNFYAQALRYLKTKQALNGFSVASNRKNIFNDLGSDGRIRSYLNPYGSQSARYQPPSTSFIFLKPAWTRSLVHPSSNRVVVGIDYKSEEALIGALNSNDEAMIEAYKSGDVYLDFAKRAGAIPHDGTKEEYKKERDLFKSTYLGISYLMGAKSLAKKLTSDTGKLYTESDAKDLIEKFYKAYPTYKKYLDDVVYDYDRLGLIKLEDGWTMFGDNDNFRSVSNMPIQGMGSCILRRAIALAQDRGLNVIIPLHDALYIECGVEDLQTSTDILADCMVEAFKINYPDNPKAELIRLDIEAWGDKLEAGVVRTPKNRTINLERVHVDSRGKREYEMYKKYFTTH